MFSSLIHGTRRAACLRAGRLGRAAAFVVAIALAGCSGGADTLTQSAVPLGAADLDTAKPPPQTVTSTPLLPPVPESPSQPSSVGALPPATSDSEQQQPLQYDPLYSDEEQLRLKSDLAAAAARVQKP